MQYARLNLSEDISVLVDAEELGALENYRLTKKELKTIEPDDHELEYKIVYAAFLPQPGTEEKVTESINQMKGYALGFIYRDACHLMQLVDVQIYEQNRKNFMHPAVALIRTNAEIPTSKSRAISAFLRYYGMMVEDNILNRSGILSIRDQERRIKGELSAENWKDFIDVDRAMRIGTKAY